MANVVLWGRNARPHGDHIGHIEPNVANCRRRCDCGVSAVSHLSIRAEVGRPVGFVAGGSSELPITLVFSKLPPAGGATSYRSFFVLSFSKFRNYHLLVLILEIIL
jgi:hypothetical protein